jgi:hypothetical protein
MGADWQPTQAEAFHSDVKLLGITLFSSAAGSLYNNSISAFKTRLTNAELAT